MENIKKFKSIPVEIEAIKLKLTNTKEVLCWIEANLKEGEKCKSSDNQIMLETDGIEYLASIGDWIARDKEGCFYVMIEEHLEKYYENVEE